jgi:hypothetical protein
VFGSFLIEFCRVPSIPSGAKQAAEKLLISGSVSSESGFLGLSARFAAVSSLRFASGGRFSGLQAHFDPNGPAIQPESVSACAPGYAPRRLDVKFQQVVHSI